MWFLVVFILFFGLFPLVFVVFGRFPWVSFVGFSCFPTPLALFESLRFCGGVSVDGNLPVVAHPTSVDPLSGNLRLR